MPPILDLTLFLVNFLYLFIMMCGDLITLIFNLNSYLIYLIFRLLLCNYDACYHSFYEFSLLVCHSTKVHVYALFRVNYVLYECLIF